MTQPTLKDLLLAPHVEPRQVAELLSPYGFKDAARADANLQAMASEPTERYLLAYILEELLVCLSRSADPTQGMNYLERFVRAAGNKIRLFSHLRDSPRTIEILARTLGGSPYMAEILIRDPRHFYWVTDPNILYGRRRKREIELELIRALRSLPDEQKRLDHVRFLKRREMLRIGVRDLLRICSVEETLESLSILAEALISATYWICSFAMRNNYDVPPKALTGFTILAMGKLGGGELNFSSDVDLMYLYADPEPASGTSSATSSSLPSPDEYFHRLCQKISAGLNEFTGEGYVYRVDLRLRPEGNAGDLASSLSGFKRYYRTRPTTWERLALLKAWPVAGDRALGRAFLAMAREFVYDRPFDLKALEDVRSMKRKIDQKMAARQQQMRNVKLGTGGIREIELIAQSLEIRYGSRIPELRERNTLKALTALCGHNLISTDQCSTLSRAYVFLRDVENKLQMVHDAQTHSLPEEREELTTCARLLGYSGPPDWVAEQFLNDYQQHTSHVSRIFESIIQADAAWNLPIQDS